MSGIEAVRKIVETEAQAKKIVEDAKSQSQEILSRAADEALRVRKAAISAVELRKAEILRETRERAEKDAVASDEETDSLIQNYQKLFAVKKDAAVDKAVELILGT